MSYRGNNSDTTKFDRADGRHAVPSGGSGTVTSVAITMPTGVFDISGSPITSSGTLAITFDTQSANRIFAGPTTGSAAAPAFRALVAADLPFTGTPTGSKFLRDDLSWQTPSAGSVAFSDITSGTNSTAAMVVETGATITFHDNTCIFQDDTGGSGVRTVELVYADSGPGDFGFTVALPSISGIIIVDQGAQDFVGVKSFTVQPIMLVGFKVSDGSNKAMGAATLVGGTVTVSNNTVTANTRIFLTGQNSSGTHGELTVSARSAGTSFTITSSSGTDTRSVAWLLVEPS